MQNTQDIITLGGVTCEVICSTLTHDTRIDTLTHGVEVDDSWWWVFQDLWMFKNNAIEMTYCVVKDTGGAG